MSCTHLLLVAFWLALQVAVGQTPIQFGNTVTGAIECGQAGVYTLTARQGDKLIAHVTETRDRGGICPSLYGPVAACAFDQRIEVREESDELVGAVSSPLESNACLHGLRTQLGPVTLPRSGRYTITVRDADNFGRGDYALSVQRTNGPFQATILSVPDVRIVPLPSAGMLQAFIFAGVQGTDTRIEMKSLPGGMVKPQLALYGPGGDPVALPDSGQLRYVVRQTGEHTLLVFSSINETGNAELTSSTGPWPSSNPVISQIADGGGWRTTLTLVNHSDGPAPFAIRAWSDAGVRWPVVWDGPDQGTIPLRGSRTISTLNAGPVTSQGWAELVTANPVSLQGLFRSSTGQEAGVSGIRSMSGFVLPFDNTQLVVTSMAVVNTSETNAAVVTVVFRDEAGNSLGTESFTLLPRAHEALAMPARFPAVRDRRGVAEFTTESPDLTALGLRFTPSGAFTSLPVQPRLP